MRSFAINDLLHPEEATGADGFFIRGDIPKWLQFSANIASTTNLLPGTQGKRYRVHGLVLANAGASLLNWGLYAGSASVILGSFATLSQQVVTLPFSPVGWCQTDYSQALNFYETAAVIANGVLIYVELP